MPKKAPKAKSKLQEPNAAEVRVQNTVPSTPAFPQISEKGDLMCSVLEPAQILLINDLLSPYECKQYVKFIEDLPLELTPPPKKGEAERINHRLSINSPTFAHSLFQVLNPFLPEFPVVTSPRRKPAQLGARRAHSLNSNIRLYKYMPGQRFGAHYDDSVVDLVTGAQSGWTLLIYLSGEDDGLQGGETVFYKKKGKSTEEIRVAPQRGLALLHKHGHDCLLHEGAPVLSGVKYILRSDVMFTP